MFRDGQFPDYRYEDYYLNATPLFDLSHLKAYTLDYADIILTKCITGREADQKVIFDLKSRGITIPKEELEKRFKKIIPSKGKEEIFKKRFENFLRFYY